MATNGGIIGKSNNASFGKCTVTTVTSTGNTSFQTGTRLVNATIVEVEVLVVVRTLVAEVVLVVLEILHVLVFLEMFL